MKYQKLGNSDITVSQVSLGTWGLGGGSVWSDFNSSEQDVISLLSACLDYGINYIDTAPVYGTGESERLLGIALQGRRDKFVVQTKCSLNWRNDGGHFHYGRDGYTVNNDTCANAIRKDVEDSLERMHTEFIDSLIVHYVRHDTPVQETVSALEELKKEGKIRTYGISNSQPDDLKEYASSGNPDLVQEFFSILSPFHGRDYFPACKETGATFQVYGVLEEGYLASPSFLERDYQGNDIRARIPWAKPEYKQPLHDMFNAWKQLCTQYGCSYANLAEAWALSQYENMNLLVGMRREKTMLDTVKCLNVGLRPEEIRFLEDTVRKIQVEVLDK